MTSLRRPLAASLALLVMAQPAFSAARVLPVAAARAVAPVARVPLALPAGGMLARPLSVMPTLTPVAPGAPSVSVSLEALRAAVP
ncbi:MAG: hypothetical protein SF051_12025, partial [Elusimicrobiota bacterium]|nr:hypothetical protein [Elusimicrobiota bacterium]